MHAAFSRASPRPLSSDAPCTARVAEPPAHSLRSLAVTAVFSASGAHDDVEHTATALVDPPLYSAPLGRSHDQNVTEFLDGLRKPWMTKNAL